MVDMGSYGAMTGLPEADEERDKRQSECTHHWDWQRTPFMQEYRRWCFKCGKWDNGEKPTDA